MNKCIPHRISNCYQFDHREWERKKVCGRKSNFGFPSIFWWVFVCVPNLFPHFWPESTELYVIDYYYIALNKSNAFETFYFVWNALNFFSSCSSFMLCIEIDEITVVIYGKKCVLFCSVLFVGHQKKKVFHIFFFIKNVHNRFMRVSKKKKFQEKNRRAIKRAQSREGEREPRARRRKLDETFFLLL